MCPDDRDRPGVDTDRGGAASHALMVCGTASDVGKTQIVAGLCRLLARQGVRVAPFKAQNMALNSYVTASGHEIGRAQAMQAFAAGVSPEVGMNPILLKPTGERTSQVIVNGEPLADMDANQFEAYKPQLLGVVLDALSDLRSRFDTIILEGAGGAAEINLLENDVANLRIAVEAEIPALIVGDIDRGGVFAALYGTFTLLPDPQRARVRGFVINKFRGDAGLLGDGCVELERRCGIPTVGIIPWLEDIAIDAEDSLALPAPAKTADPGLDTLDVAVVRLPHISNFTDVDPLTLQPGVAVRYVSDEASLGRPDLVVLPGTKTTVEDLAWLRARGLDPAIAASGATVLGICGGYQMLGHTITDTIESHQGTVPGLGWLDATTGFDAYKVTRQRTGTASGLPITGYQIHHGRVTGRPSWLRLDGSDRNEHEGATAPERDGRGPVFATTLHGIFEADDFRTNFLTVVARRRGKQLALHATSFAATREAQYDRIADALETHLDIAAVHAASWTEIGSRAFGPSDASW
jgi:adenosylcobyric acid synthase